jgi:hypothetical protein
LMVKPEGKRPLGRRRRRWKDNIKIDHKEIWWGVMNWIHVAQDRDQWQAIVNTVISLRGSIKWWAILECLSGWRLLKKDSPPWSYLWLDSGRNQPRFISEVLSQHLHWGTDGNDQFKPGAARIRGNVNRSISTFGWRREVW